MMFKKTSSIIKIISITFWISLAGYISLSISLFYPFSKCIKEPAFKYDFGHLYVNAKNTAQNLIEYKRFWGFNPFFSAGDGEIEAFSNKIITFFFWLLPELHKPLLHNVTILIIILILPFIIMLSGHFFSPVQVSKKSIFILTAILCYGSNIGREFIYIGHYGYLLSSALSLLAASFLMKYFESRKIRYMILQGITSGIVIWTNATNVPVLLILYSGILFFHYKSIRLKDFKRFLLSLPLVIIPNLYWALPYGDYLIREHKKNDLAQFLQTDTVQHMLQALPIVISLSVFLGLWKWRKKINYPLVFVLCSISFLSLFGTQVGLGDLQPARLALPTLFIFIIVISHYSPPKILLIISSLLILSLYQTQYNNRFEHTVGCGMYNPRLKKLIHFLQANLSSDSRLHIQDSHSLPYFNTRITSLIPELTGYPTLAAPFTYPVEFTQFIDDRLFNKEISSMKPSYFLRYSQYYNTDIYLVHSAAAKKFLSEQIKAEEIYQDNELKIYKIPNVTRSYCIDCDAKVAFGINYINVEEANSEKTTLKFRYSTKLLTIPSGMKITPVCIEDNPVPFIQVHNNSIKKFKIVRDNSFFFMKDIPKKCYLN